MNVLNYQKYLTSGFFLNLPIVLNLTISLVTIPIILSNVPVVDYGRWQFACVFQTWILTLTAANITTGSKRGIANGLDGTFVYAFVKRFKLMVLAAIVTSILAGAIAFFKNDSLSIMLYMVAIYLVLGQQFQVSFFAFLLAKKRFKEWCFWQILINSISIMGSTSIVYFTKNIFYFVVSQLAIMALISIFAWLLIFIRENLLEHYKSGRVDKKCSSYGVKLIPYSIVSMTSRKMAHFLILVFLGFESLAFFSVANKLYEKFTGVLKSCNSLLYADFAVRQKAELQKKIRRYAFKICFLSIILFFTAVGAAWVYIKYFLPEEFYHTILYFVILAMGLPAVFLGVILHTLLESHLKHKELTIVGFVVSACRVVLILIFGYYKGVTGICFALVLANFVYLGTCYLLAYKKPVLVTRLTGINRYVFKSS